MRIAETLHVYSFDAQAWAAAAALGGAGMLASIYFAVAPLIESIELSTHYFLSVD